MPKKQNNLSQFWNKNKFPVLNFINRQISNFRNNRFFNWIKESYPCPIYLYCDTTGEYVAEFNPVWNKFEKYWEADIQLVSSYDFAKNYESSWWFQRRTILRLINEAVATGDAQRVFRWKKIMSLEFTMDIPMDDLLG